ncbi:MAG: M14 family metallopeptidase [Thermoanaerobacteraceae bacterium]|nr:M14 family metallopeptidase [Thermoanaerobacteraceae bacterium]
MQSLNEVFELSGLMLDKDDDGIKDTFDGNIWIKEGLNSAGKSLAVNLAARIGKESLGYDRDPIIRICDGGPKRGFIIENGERSGIFLEGDAVRIIVGERDGVLLERYICQKFPGLPGDRDIGDLKSSCSRDITGIIFYDRAMEVILSGSDDRVYIPIDESYVEASHREKSARTINLSDLFSFNGMYQRIREDYLPQTTATIIIPQDIRDAEIEDIGKIALKMGIESIEMIFPLCIYEGQALSLTDYHCPIVIGPSKLYDGSERGISLVLDDSGFGFIYVNRHDLKAAADYFLNTYPYIDEKRIYSLASIKDMAERYAARDDAIKSEGCVSKKLEWEVDEVRRLIREEVVPILNMTDRVDVLCALSEEGVVRERLKDEITGLISPKAGQVNVDILSSYKQGYYWIKEKVIPAALKYRGRISKVVITFRMEENEPLKNDSRVPDMNILSKGSISSMELPIRWLLELYPVDKLIASELSIAKDGIRFEPDGKHTYGICIYDMDSNLIMSDSFDAMVHPMRYIGCFPDTPMVNPETGFLKVDINGRPAISMEIMPDSLRIWEHYQEFLLEMWDSIEEDDGEEVRFDGIDFDICMSDIDEDLPFDEDRISTLEALEEDLYFVTLDFMRMAEGRSGKRIIPGLIRPIIHSSYDSPEFTAFYRILKRNDAKDSNMSIIGIEPSRGFINLRIKGYDDDDFEVRVGERDTDIEVLFADGNGIANLPKNVLPYASHLKDEVIGYDEYVAMALNLYGSGLRAELAATSLMGRYIYAVYMHSPLSAEIVSENKWFFIKPTLLINCRHHANEVSSTNAAFMLIESTLKDMDKLRNINLVIIPEENVDGSAFLHELISEHPKWKHHPVRYNARGIEFGHKYWKCPEGEARTLPHVVEKTLPILFLDAHGVPSHEWDQPFSGYVPPAFRGFWLPRSFIYYYFWEPASYNEENRYIKENIKRHIKESLLNIPWLKSRNEDLLKTYNRYMGEWMRDIVGQDPEDGLFFEIPVNSMTHISEVFPYITYIDMTSEVIDEVAQGQHLENCIMVHLATFNAVIACMNELIERGWWRGHIQSVRM